MALGAVVNGFLIYVRDAQGVDSLYATAFAEDRLVMLNIADQSSKQIVIIPFDGQGLRGCATDALGITTGIEDTPFVTAGNQSNINVSIVPNPTSGSTTIRFTCGTDVRAQSTVDIINLLGQRVATLTITDPALGWNQVEWDAQGFEAGTYYVRIESPTGNTVAPISVIR